MEMNTGQSRTTLNNNYALIAPDSHVRSELSAWTDTEIVVLISDRMGAQFTQYFAEVNSDSVLDLHDSDRSRLIFIEEGTATLKTENNQSESLKEENYVYVPPEQKGQLKSSETGRFIVFEKDYCPVDDSSNTLPSLITGNLEDVNKDPFMGDPRARLQSLLPDDEVFDFGIYVFNFEPGATLPIVESHFMEHGLVFLDGQGVYRLNDDWYPVEQGDSIWMAPYLPQWFAATGNETTRYIYYKDTNRHPSEGYS